MKNKIHRNDLCPCESGKKYKKCYIKEKQNLLIDKEYLMQLKKEVEDKVGKKVKISFIEQNCDIDAMKKEGLLEDMGDGLYKVLKFKLSK